MSLANTQWSWLCMFRGKPFFRQKNQFVKESFHQYFIYSFSVEKIAGQNTRTTNYPLAIVPAGRRNRKAQILATAHFVKGPEPLTQRGMPGRLGCSGKPIEEDFQSGTVPSSSSSALHSLLSPNPAQTTPGDHGTFLECALASKKGCLPCCWQLLKNWKSPHPPSKLLG